jgi:hypothetical protein
MAARHYLRLSKSCTGQSSKACKELHLVRRLPSCWCPQRPDIILRSGRFPFSGIETIRLGRGLVNIVGGWSRRYHGRISRVTVTWEEPTAFISELLKYASVTLELETEHDVCSLHHDDDNYITTTTSSSLHARLLRMNWARNICSFIPDYRKI